MRDLCWWLSYLVGQRQSRLVHAAFVGGGRALCRVMCGCTGKGQDRAWEMHPHAATGMAARGHIAAHMCLKNVGQKETYIWEHMPSCRFSICNRNTCVPCKGCSHVGHSACRAGMNWHHHPQPGQHMQELLTVRWSQD